MEVREAALAQVTAELQRQGLLDEAGEVSRDAHARLDWAREMSLPTPGIVVKACLDAGGLGPGFRHDNLPQ